MDQGDGDGEKWWDAVYIFKKEMSLSSWMWDLQDKIRVQDDYKVRLEHNFGRKGEVQAL